MPGIPHCRSADHDIASTGAAWRSSSHRRAAHRQPRARAASCERAAVAMTTRAKKSNPPTRPRRRKGMIQIDFKNEVAAAGGCRAPCVVAVAGPPRRT